MQTDYLLVPTGPAQLPSIPLPQHSDYSSSSLKGYGHSSAYLNGMSQPGDGHLVPQMVGTSTGQPAGTARLTAAQAAELEMARRRAQKAAEGKRANATAVRRAKRRAAEMAEGCRQVPELSVPEESPKREERDDDDEEPDGNEDLEARLANAKDEKEAKRLKRLLRNRVSAQQARERKKSYVNGLEGRVKAAEQRAAQADQRVRVLERENAMLRQVIQNMQQGQSD